MDHDQRLTESLISAIGTGDIGLVENLIRRQGADVNAGFPARRLRVGEQAMIAGTRPIQFAARRKDVTATRLLLNSGADPGLPDRYGYTAIHAAADHGDPETLDLLLSARPASQATKAALTTPTSNGASPLSLAAANGHSTAVSRLLRAGAKHLAIMAPCPLSGAIGGGHAGVVRLLLDNIDAVGRLAKLSVVLTCASLRGRAKILNMLLSVEGEKMRRKWARESCGGFPLLTFAAGYGVLANVDVLLAAGADETIVDSMGRSVTDVIGLCLEDDQKDPVEARAISRALQRAPAYRASSWLWRSASLGPTAARSPASSPSQEPRSPLGVAVFRPSKNKLVMRPVFRYALKR